MSAKIFFADVNVGASEAERGAKERHLRKVLPGVYVSAATTEQQAAELLRAHALRIIAGAKEKSRAVLVASHDSYESVRGVLVLNESADRAKRKIWAGGLLVEMPAIEGALGDANISRIVYAKDGVGEYEFRGLTNAALLVADSICAAKLASAGDDISSVLMGSALRSRILQKCISEFGSIDLVRTEIAQIAGRLGVRDSEGMARSICQGVNADVGVSADALVYWHKTLVGAINFDRGEPIITSLDRHVRLSLADRVGAAAINPSFVASLMPEGVAAIAHAGRRVEDSVSASLETAARGARLMSNIEIVCGKDRDPNHELVEDVLAARLRSFTSDKGEFIGRWVTQGLVGSHSQTGRDQLAPLQSGHQEKAPMSLGDDGVLRPSGRGQAFTHMVKMSPPGLLASISAMEWMGLSIFKQVGIETEDFAIGQNPMGGAPLLIVERFDIKRSINDKNRYIMEDIWSILRSRTGRAKYQADLVRDVAPTLAKVEGAGEKFMDVVISSWIIQNEDMHSKNVSFLTVVDSETGIVKTSLSPSYDITTNAAHSIATGKASMPINGKAVYTVTELAEFGAAIGMKRDDVFDRVKRLATGIKAAVTNLREEVLPGCILSHEESLNAYRVSAEKITKRCDVALSQVVECGAAADARNKGPDTLVFSAFSRR